jgi:hypothetical protein
VQLNRQFELPREVKLRNAINLVNGPGLPEIAKGVLRDSKPALCTAR